MELVKNKTIAIVIVSVFNIFITEKEHVLTFKKKEQKRKVISV